MTTFRRLPNKIHGDSIVSTEKGDEFSLQERGLECEQVAALLADGNVAKLLASFDFKAGVWVLRQWTPSGRADQQRMLRRVIGCGEQSADGGADLISTLWRSGEEILLVLEQSC